MLQKGMSLVELIVAMVITSVILMSAGRVMLISQQAIRIGAVEADLSHQATAICDRIANDLKDAMGTITVTSNSGQVANTKISFNKNPTYELDKTDGKYKKHNSSITYELKEDTRMGRAFWYIERTMIRDGGTAQTEVLSDCSTKAGTTFNLAPASLDPTGKTYVINVQLLREIRADTDNDAAGTHSGGTSDLWWIEQNSMEYFLVLRSTTVHLNF